MNSFSDIVGYVSVLASSLMLMLGFFHWMWMAIQMGSFFMFVIGIFPITAIFATPIGLWSLIFGVPNWIYAVFG